MSDEARVTRSSIDTLVKSDGTVRVTRASLDTLIRSSGTARVTRASVDTLIRSGGTARATRVSLDSLIKLVPPPAPDFEGWGLPIGGTAVTPPTEDWTVYAETIGDGNATEIQVTHSLDTTDVIVAVYDLTGADPVEVVADITVIDADTVEVAFEVAPGVNERRVVVIG